MAEEYEGARWSRVAAEEEGRCGAARRRRGCGGAVLRRRRGTMVEERGGVAPQQRGRDGEGAGGAEAMSVGRGREWKRVQSP